MTNLTFKHMLIKRAYIQEQLTQMARQSRFGACEIELVAMALEVRFTKAASNLQ